MRRAARTRVEKHDQPHPARGPAPKTQQKHLKVMRTPHSMRNVSIPVEHKSYRDTELYQAVVILKRI